MRNMFFIACLAFGACEAQDTPTVKSGDAAKADAAFFTNIEKNSPVVIPGYAAAVMVDGEMVYSRATGLADITSQRAATPKTRFRIYSTSKSIGAIAAMRLAEAGKLDIDAPISTYLPDLPDHIGQITVRQIMPHQSGIRHYNAGEWYDVSDTNCAGPLDAFPDFINDPLKFEPGQGNQYSTFAYVVLAAALEAASGLPFDEFIEEWVFKPAGMTATAIEGRPTPGYDVATFYYSTEDKTAEPEPTDGVDASCKFFGGGFVSTAEDLARFGQAVVDGRLVSKETLDEMLQVYAEGTDSHPPKGYGFFSGEAFVHFGVPENEIIENWFHGGSGAGGYSVMIIYPEHNAAVGLASNARGTGVLVRAAYDIGAAFLDAPKPEME